MPRLMSVTLTTPQVQVRSKDVTRRMGWWTDKHGNRMLQPGDRLTLCRKVMGRRKGEPLVRVAEVEVVAVRREKLYMITDDEVRREGFPHWTTHEFIDFFCESHKGCQPDSYVTRIEWRYLDDGGDGDA